MILQCLIMREIITTISNSFQNILDEGYFLELKMHLQIQNVIRVCNDMQDNIGV